MNAIERSALDALKGCTYAPATSEKRFVRQLTPETVLSDKQREWFWLIVWRYRNQHKSEELAIYAQAKMPSKEELKRAAVKIEHLEKYGVKYCECSEACKL